VIEFLVVEDEELTGIYERLLQIFHPFAIPLLTGLFSLLTSNFVYPRKCIVLPQDISQQLTVL
jgi:hypothetical protein